MRTKTHKQLKLQIPKFNKENLRLLNTPVCSKKITTLVIPPHTRRLYLAYYTASTDPRADEKTFVAFLLMPEYVDPKSNDTDATRYFLRRLAGTAPFHWRFEREYVPVRPPHLNALVFLTTVPSDMFEGSLMTLISEVPINQGVVEYWVSNWVADVLSHLAVSGIVPPLPAGGGWVVYRKGLYFARFFGGPQPRGIPTCTMEGDAVGYELGE